MSETQSSIEPTVRRWQDSYEIPVGVAKNTETDENGDQRIFWTYTRLVVPTLHEVDVTEAADRAGLTEHLDEALDRANPRMRNLAREVQGIKERAAAQAAKASPSAKDVAAAVASE